MVAEKRDFDKDAATWDTPPRVKLAGDIIEAVLKNVTLSPGMDLLDFGCGTGLVSLPLCAHVRSVTGVDSSRGMLTVLEGKARELQVSNIRAVHLNLEQGAKIEGLYDGIVSSMVLHHVKDTARLFKDFYETLKPGGFVALADLDEEGGLFHDNNDGVLHFGFSRPHLLRLLRETGFQDAQAVTATVMTKPGADGQVRDFSIFLLTAFKE